MDNNKLQKKKLITNIFFFFLAVEIYHLKKILSLSWTNYLCEVTPVV